MSVVLVFWVCFWFVDLMLLEFEYLLICFDLILVCLFCRLCWCWLCWGSVCTFVFGLFMV